MKLHHRRSLAIALLLVPAVLTGCVASWSGHDRALTGRLDEILNRLADTGAVVTARVVELDTGRELYAHEIDTPFTPASNMKIPVSAAGLDMFGVAHTFKTYLARDGDDLWVIGTGDPGTGDPRLERRRGCEPTGLFDDWADALRQHGIARITGDLVYYDGALDDQWLHPSWGEDVLHWYGAATSGLNLNDNCIDITIHPAEDGQPVRYEVMPPVKNITVINECVTASEHEPTIEKLPEGDIYKLAGTCAKRAELKSKPVGDPGAFFCDALRTHLATRGISIDGEIRRSPIPLDNWTPPDPDKVVAVHETTARDILGRINTNSQNFFAEAFCKLTGQAFAARHGRLAPGSWADGEQAIRAFLRRLDIDDSGFVVADGSGLSDDNRLTARLLTDLYAAMLERPDGQEYLNSLAKAGVNGGLQERLTDLKGRVFAKTGYIGGVRALSGYVRTMDEEWLTFAIIYNRIPGSVKPYEELQDEAVRLIAHWPDLEQAPGAQPAQTESSR